MTSTFDPMNGSGWFSGFITMRHRNSDGKSNGIVRVQVTDPGSTWRKPGDVVDVGEAAETVTADTLDARMGLDASVVRIGGKSPSGATYISDEPDVYAPEVYEIGGELDDAMMGEWTLLDGYSGQYRYSGPVMHPSEYIGGRMADDILATPGLYATVVVTSLDDEDDEDNISGWAVAFRG